MPNTLPGVKVTLADGYYSASDDTVNADRILIIAEPLINTTLTMPTDSNTVPNNPLNYKTVTSVIADFGVNSGCHVAFMQAIRAGASNIYISCTDPAEYMTYANDAYTIDQTNRQVEFAAALQYADLVTPDIIVAHGFYANDYVVGGTNDSVCTYAEDLAQKCVDLTNDVNPCLGVMGVVPLDIHHDGTDYSAADVDAYVVDLTSEYIATGHYSHPAPMANVLAVLKSSDPDDPAVPDLDRYLAVVVGECTTVDQPDKEYVSAAVVFASLIYATPLYSSVTNKPLLNVDNIAYNLSKSQRLDLIKIRLNPIGLSSDRTFISVDGWTCALPLDWVATDQLMEEQEIVYESYYNRISTVRIVNDVVKATRRTLEGFIGMQASVARMNSISTLLRSLYNGYKSVGILSDYRFTVRYQQSAQSLKVDLTLIPFGEMREIDLTVTVQVQA
jgi:hypothetical protein